MTTLPAAPAGSRRGTYLLLGSLYITQYLGLGFFFTALVAILRQQGVPLEQLNTIYVLGLFWILKFLWAPLVDRVSFGRLGHYRGWLILMQSLLVVTLLVMGFFDLGSQLALILGFCMLAGLFSATQDIAADALSCCLLSPAERGVDNGFQIGGGASGQCDWRRAGADALPDDRLVRQHAAARRWHRHHAGTALVLSRAGDDHGAP